MHFSLINDKIKIVDLIKGALAQLGERLSGRQEVSGSIPLCSIVKNRNQLRLRFFCILGVQLTCRGYRKSIDKSFLANYNAAEFSFIKPKWLFLVSILYE